MLRSGRIVLLGLFGIELSVDWDGLPPDE